MLYVTDQRLIRRVEISSGKVTTFAGADDPYVQSSVDGVGVGARFVSAAGITTDGNGNLFVGDAEAHALRKITIATAEVTTVADISTPVVGTNITGALWDLSALAADGNGHVYIDEPNEVLRFDVDAGTLTEQIFADRLPGYVQGMLLNDAGHLLMADSSASVVWSLELASNALSVFAGQPNVIGSSDGPLATALFWGPTALAFGSDGELYVTDEGAPSIRHIDVASGSVETLAGRTLHVGSSDGARSAVRFNNPNGLATDGAGKLFVADTMNFTLRQVEVSSGIASTLAGTAGKYGTADGIGSAALFSEPVSVAVDAGGNAFVVDQGAFTIRRVSLVDGQVSTFAGTALLPGGNFWTPSDIAFDGASSLYVSDTPGFAVRKIDIATASVTTAVPAIAVDGVYSLNYPVGVVPDGTGSLYIANNQGNTISKADLATGKVSVFAGQPGVADSDDGVGAAATFNGPLDLALDAARGFLYVSEPDNHLVRRIRLDDAEVTTFAGVRGQAGVKLGALPGGLNAPSGLAVLPSGQVAISDRAENVILIAY